MLSEQGRAPTRVWLRFNWPGARCWGPVAHTGQAPSHSVILGGLCVPRDATWQEDLKSKLII